MIATVKIDGILYNANDRKIYHNQADKRIKKNSHQGTIS